MKRLVLIYFFLSSYLSCFADYSSRGRPWDNPYYHESPLTPIFLVISGILLLFIGGIWLYSVSQKKKSSIQSGLSTFVVISLIVGGVFSIAKWNEEIKHKNKDEDYKVQKSIPMREIKNATQPCTNFYKKSFNTSTSRPHILKRRTVEYYETCTFCKGAGKLVCPKCHGSGWIESICSSCNGRGNYGNFTCLYCKGTGYVEDSVFGTGKHNCISCNGTGFTTKSCIQCSGTGKDTKICNIEATMYHKTHYITCLHCNGLGKVRKT